MKLLFNSFRPHAEIEAILKKEVNEEITVITWTDNTGEQIQGYGIMDNVHPRDVWQMYVVFGFLKINIAFINVPVQWNHEGKEHKEPLTTWKTFEPYHIQSPVDFDVIAGKVTSQLGLHMNQILNIKVSRPGASSSALKRKVPTVYIIDVYTDKSLEKPVTVLEIEVDRSEDERTGMPRQSLESESVHALAKLLQADKRIKYALATLHGEKEQCGYLTR